MVIFHLEMLSVWTELKELLSFDKKLKQNDVFQALHLPDSQTVCEGERVEFPGIFQEHLLLLINPFPNKPWFLRVCSTSLLKTLWEKEKLLVTSNFSFSHSVFFPFRELPVIFIKFEIVVCKLFQFGRV